MVCQHDVQRKASEQLEAGFSGLEACLSRNTSLLLSLDRARG